MKVYIEQVFFNNFFIDFLLVTLTATSLRQKLHFFRVCIACVFASLSAILLPLVYVEGVYLYVVKVVCGAVICIVACSAKTFKDNTLFFIVFLSYTLLFGGLSFALICISGASVDGLGQISYSLPIWLVNLMLVLYATFMFKVIKVFYAKQKISNFNYKLKLTVLGKSKTITAYLDTGNTLVDNLTGKGVVVMSLKNIIKFTKLNPLDIITKRPISSLKNAHYINYTTVSGNSNMLVFEPDSIVDKTNDKQLNCLIGVSVVGLNNNFEALLGPMAL